MHHIYVRVEPILFFLMIILFFTYQCSPIFESIIIKKKKITT